MVILARDSGQYVYIHQCQKSGLFLNFSELRNFVLWTFSLLKMTIFILLTFILLLPIPLKTLAEHKKIANW